MFRAAASFSLFLVACSAGAGSDPSAATGDRLTNEGPSVLLPVDGPIRLGGSCAIGDRTERFVVDPGAEAFNIYVGRIDSGVGHTDYATAAVSVGAAPSYAPTLETLRNHPWSAAGTPSVVVTQPSLEIGGSVTLQDSTIVPGTPIACTAKLAATPMLWMTATADASAPLDALTTTRLAIDVPLPNHTSCGVALTSSAPLPPDAAYRFVGALDVPSELVVTARDDRTLTLTVPSAHGWDIVLAIEAKDHTTPLRDELRSIFPSGTLTGLGCPR
jgi:hypothetical protein